MKESKKSLQIRVGAFVSIGLAVMMLMIFILGGGKRLFEKDFELLTQFNDISGLRQGAPVQLAGVQVGTVEGILFAESLADKKVKVLVKVQTRFQQRIRENSVATIVTQGLLGDKMIQVTVGNPDTRMLTDGDYLRSAEPPNFNDMIVRAGELLENVNKVSMNINGILEEVRQGDGFMNELIYGHEGTELLRDLNDAADHFKSASAQLEGISGKINNGQGTIGALVNDASMYNDVKTLFGKANRNKLIRAVIRYTLSTKDEKLLQKE
jgi:phospholipid/cholesterol/gamma-HCH transport system substrate-binding protein